MWALVVLTCSAAAAPVDRHDNCRRWAEEGECQANPTYMHTECALSCSGTKAASKVSQVSRECDGYAEQGECNRNPAFMLSTCRKQCDAWERKHGLRIDRDAKCVEYAILGHCTLPKQEQKVDMARQCNTSCTVHERCAASTYTGWSVGICDKALRCEATDKRQGCAERAARGECREQPAKMAVECLASCAKHDVDAVLAAQKPEMRARLSPLYDVPTALAGAHDRCWLNGWAGHNSHKLMLPTQCAAPRKLPWQRRRVPPRRQLGSLDDALTCPMDVRQTTPRIARWPTRNVTLEAAHTEHAVRVTQVSASPRIRLLREFITADEAAELLRLAEPLFRRSPVRSVATDRRTSSTATLARSNWAVDRVRARISAFSGYDETMLEPLQVVRYHPGELYEPHHDLFDLCDFPQKPRRHLTFLIYLNDLPPGAGGETTFPRLSLRVAPEKHMALVFNDVLDNGMDDERTEHAGTPPSSGVKYAINCWIRARETDGGWLAKNAHWGRLFG